MSMSENNENDPASSHKLKNYERIFVDSVSLLEDEFRWDPKHR